MQYRHPEDGEKRCMCPACGWRGTLHQTEEFTPNEGGESFQVCPKCAADVPVITDQYRTRPADDGGFYFLSGGTD